MAQSMRSSDGSQGVYRLEEPPIQEFCGGVECYLSDAHLATLLLLVGFLGFAALFAFLYLKGARSACRREARRVRSEHDAYEQFARRVAELDAVRTPAAGTPASGSTLAATSSAGDRTRRIRQLFSETVMAVDHYDEEYGESLETHVGAELGDQARSIVTADGPLTPNEQRAVVTTAAKARRRRELLIDALEREHDQVVDAWDQLSEADQAVQEDRSDAVLDRGFDDLAAGWHRLDRVESDCDRLIDQRQHRIHNGVAVPGQRWDGIEFCQYLYGSLSVTHPVLASASVVLDRLRTRKRTLSTAITRRV